MGRIVVVGAGRSGLGAAEHLAKAGKEVVVTDSRPAPTPRPRPVWRSSPSPGCGARTPSPSWTAARRWC